MCVVCSFSVRPPAAPPVPSLSLQFTWVALIATALRPGGRFIKTGKWWEMKRRVTLDSFPFATFHGRSMARPKIARNIQLKNVFFPRSNGKTLSIFHSYSPLHHHPPLFLHFTLARLQDRQRHSPTCVAMPTFFLCKRNSIKVCLVKTIPRGQGEEVGGGGSVRTAERTGRG